MLKKLTLCLNAIYKLSKQMINGIVAANKIVDRSVASHKELVPYRAESHIRLSDLLLDTPHKSTLPFLNSDRNGRSAITTNIISGQIKFRINEITYALFLSQSEKISIRKHNADDDQCHRCCDSSDIGANCLKRSWKMHMKNQHKNECKCAYIKRC